MIIRKTLVFFSLGILTFTLFPGCIATRNDIFDLQTTVGELQREIVQLRKNQASLSADIKELNQNIAVLSEKLDTNQKSTGNLAQKLDDIDAGVDRRLAEILKRIPQPVNIKGNQPTPTELYMLAYADYFAGKYNLSIVEFEKYLARYPDSEFAPLAQYYLGECYFTKEDWPRAVEEFAKVKQNYPRSDKVLSSELKKAYALQTLNENDKAKTTLESIVATNPNSMEGKLAKEKLDLWYGKKINPK